MKLGFVSLSTIATALLVSGCASNHVHKGAVIDPQFASSIQPGVDNKASVTKVLGSPTLASEFTPNEWYYWSADTNQLAFHNPHPTKQLVILVRFDQAGNVTSVQRSGRELALNVNPSHRETPTLGRRKSFFDELFNNIGSVSPGGMGQGGGGNGP